MTAPQHIPETEEAFEALRTGNDTLIAYLSTPQCRVCKTLRPQIAEMAHEEGIPFAYVDTTQLTTVAGQRLVFAVPTMLVFVYGQEFARFSRHFSTQELRERLVRAREIVTEDH